MKAHGLRVDSKEMEGLFTKKGGADRYLVCLTRARVDSGRPIWIVRPGRDSARGRAVACGWKLAGVGRSSDPELGSA